MDKHMSLEEQQLYNRKQFAAGYIKVGLQNDRVMEAGMNREWMWAESASEYGEGAYRLLNTSFYDEGYQWGDIVEAFETDTPGLYMIRHRLPRADEAEA